MIEKRNEKNYLKNTCLRNLFKVRTYHYPKFYLLYSNTKSNYIENIPEKTDLRT